MRLPKVFILSIAAGPVHSSAAAEVGVITRNLYVGTDVDAVITEQRIDYIWPRSCACPGHWRSDEKLRLDGGLTTRI
jgi:hypothetical protein